MSSVFVPISYKRLLLDEIGFLAGQHELIDIAYSKEAVDNLKTRVKEVKKEIQNNDKSFKAMEAQMNKSYQRLEVATNKYKNAHNAMEKASKDFEDAQGSMNVTKAEVERTKSTQDQRIQACQIAKGEYASQVQASNQEQKDHFTVNLPDVFSR